MVKVNLSLQKNKKKFIVCGDSGLGVGGGGMEMIVFYLYDLFILKLYVRIV